MAKATNFAIGMEITDAVTGRHVGRLRSRNSGFLTGGAGYFKAAVQGDLKRFAEQEEKLAGAAVRSSIKKATTYLRNDMNRQMRRAGITMFKRGRSEWWLAVLFDTKKQSGIGTQGKVYSGFGRAAWAFEHGAVIKGAGGKFLFLPAAGLPIDSRQIRAWNNDGRTYAIPTRNPKVKRLMLRRQGREDFLLGWLVREVRINKKIAFAEAAKRWGERIPEYIVAGWTRRAEKKGISL